VSSPCPTNNRYDPQTDNRQLATDNDQSPIDPTITTVAWTKTGYDTAIDPIDPCEPIDPIGGTQQAGRCSWQLFACDTA